MFFWFIASRVGLWFVIRNGDLRQIPEGWILYYLVFTAIIFSLLISDGIAVVRFTNGGRVMSLSLSPPPSCQLSSGGRGGFKIS